MKKLLVRSAKKLTYISAACVIIFAFFVSVSYVVTPFLDKHKQDIEKIASDALQTTVTINQVKISWYRYHPEITLDGVTIFKKESKEPSLQINKVRVFFSIPQSIWQRKLIPSAFMICGADINLRQASNGEISVQGFPILEGGNNQPYPSETKIADILGWLYTQPHLMLEDINVHFVSQRGQKRFLTLNHFSFENESLQHLISGNALLHQDIPTEVTMALRWSGNSADLQQIKAKVYLYVSGLSVGQWLKNYTWNHWQITHGISSAKVWATWRNGKFTKIQSTLQVYNLNLYSEADKQTHKINRLSGSVGVKHEGDQYIIAGEDVLIDLPEHLWPVTSFYVSLIPDAAGSFTPKIINLGYIDLSDIASYLFATNWLTEEQRQILTKLQVKGSLQNVNSMFNGKWNDYQHLSFKGNFNQLEIAPFRRFPGIENLSGNMQWNGSQGEISLLSNRLILRDESILGNPIKLDQLTGKTTFTLTPSNQLAVTIDSLHGENSDSEFLANGKILLTKESLPIVDMQASFALQQINHLARYLPVRLMDPDLVKWLKEAFLTGELYSGNVVFKGVLNQFPFDKGEGSFSVSAKVKNVTLHYAPDWPDLEHIQANLSFVGKQLLIDAEDATIFSIPVGKVQGEISNLLLAPQVLKVATHAFSVDLVRGLSFIHKSPLQDPLGKMLEGIELHGTSSLKLGLTVPLNDPSKTTTTGEIEFNNAQMQFVPWKFALTGLNGRLDFTESSINAPKIQGELFNKPFNLSLLTKQKTQNTSYLEAILKTNLAISDLEHWLKIPFAKIAKGATDANVQMAFSQKEPMSITIDSNLQGISLDLPEQYAKKSDVARPLHAEIIMPDQGPLKTRIKYGDLLSTSLLLNRKKEEFTLLGVNLRLGAGTATWPEGAGLYITGDFDELDWEKIKGYAKQSGTPVSGLELRNIDIHTKLLNIMGQKLEEARLEVTPEKDLWDIVITSKEVAGHIEVPQHITTQSIVNAQFQRLTLSKLAKVNSSTIDIKSLPAISITANHVAYDDMRLGQITFKSTPSSDGMNVQLLRINSRRMNLQASGWTQANNTRLQGTLQSSRVSELLSSFGLSEHEFVASNGTLNFDLGWHDSLFSPALASLNGRATLNLGAGRLVDVGEAGGAKMDIGRMLSIFSLQSIPRRLSLDFSDIFEKGYSFDSLKGDFTLQDGNAYTNNLRIKGPVAGVNINGRIGFTNKDYDLVISVTPYVSSVASGLPLAAAWIWPVAGLTALAVNTMIGPTISKAASYHYAVRGPWNSPNWTTVTAAR